MEEINLKEKLIPLEEVLKDYEKILISKEQLKTLLDGKKLYLTELQNINTNIINAQNEEFYKIICEDNIVGMGHILQDSTLKIKTYF